MTSSIPITSLTTAKQIQRQKLESVKLPPDIESNNT
uniref:Uncharacterized protein n=1 Tax=Rhizophora mucronata TaxID=61149 RepID=A0A2P2P6T9_RHIMU